MQSDGMVFNYCLNNKLRFAQATIELNYYQIQSLKYL